MANWSTDQINALAPDASSLKSARGLASASHWESFGSDSRTVWGYCKGSAAKPYQTTADLSDGTGKCSCPSRKFPCKHTLALMLLHVQQASSFIDTATPDWVNEWIAKRDKNAQKKSEDAQKTDDTPQSDTALAAKTKRIEERENRIRDGLDELRLWLCDTMTRGLSAVMTEPYSFWENRAARMVDAQASGFAVAIRKMAQLASGGEQNQMQLFKKMAETALLIDAYNRSGLLPVNLQYDIKTLCGWNQDQESILKRDGIKDTWHVIAQTYETNNRIRTRKTWLRGDSGKYALLLDFAVSNTPFGPAPQPALCFTGELVYYPSAAPLRALVKGALEKKSDASLHDGQSVEACFISYAEALSKNPWIQSIPVTLADTIPVYTNDRRCIVDRNRSVVEIDSAFGSFWQLLALSGGNPVTIFGEWNGISFLPLSVVTENKLSLFTNKDNEE
jgi:SWIM zinc finger